MTAGTTHRNAARLLIAMFPVSDVCRGSFDDIAASRFSRRTLPVTLEAPRNGSGS
jgi:hypothetical protein